MLYTTKMQEDAPHIAGMLQGAAMWLPAKKEETECVKHLVMENLQALAVLLWDCRVLGNARLNPLYDIIFCTIQEHA